MFSGASLRWLVCSDTASSAASRSQSSSTNWLASHARGSSGAAALRGHQRLERERRQQRRHRGALPELRRQRRHVLARLALESRRGLDLDVGERALRAQQPRGLARSAGSGSPRNASECQRARVERARAPPSERSAAPARRRWWCARAWRRAAGSPRRRARASRRTPRPGSPATGPRRMAASVFSGASVPPPRCAKSVG